MQTKQNKISKCEIKMQKYDKTTTKITNQIISTSSYCLLIKKDRRWKQGMYHPVTNNPNYSIDIHPTCYLKIFTSNKSVDHI